MCKNSVRWVYRLDAAHSWESGREVPDDTFFFDERGNLWLIVEKSGRITVTRGYAWNGCSPKLCVWDLLVGTPDGVVHAETGKPKTYYASLVHDALYQFLRNDLPYTRQDADRFFLRLLEESDFAPRGLYWLFVRAFGWIVLRGTRWKRQWRGDRVQAAEYLAEGAT